MISKEDFYVSLIYALKSNPIILAFIAPFIAGELGVITIAFFSGIGIFPLWTIIIFSFFGMIVLDSIWFSIVRNRQFEKLKKNKKIFTKYQNLEKRIEKFSNKSDLIILFISKLLIGTRILIIIYISLRKMSFKKFLLVDSIPTFLWALTLGYLGWFAGRGYYSIKTITDNLMIGEIFLALFIALIYLLIIGMRKWILKK